jgi:hypothetical protein
MKTILSPRFCKSVYFCLIFLTQTINSFAGRADSCADCYPPPGGYTRMSAGATLSQSKRLQTFDVSTLNLKNTTPQNSVQQTNAAVSISLADFNTISAVGNTWLYQSNNATFSMNIGTANNSTPQTWALPANLPSYFQGAGRSDFIAPSSVPMSLQIAGANKVMQTYYLDNNNQHMKVYDHYDVNAGSIDHIGTSYDLEVGTDDIFDEPNYEFSDVPLDLNDNFTTTIESKDYVTNLTLTKYVETITADAFGTISTPDGTFNCLRMSIVNQKYTRPNESSAYTLVSTTNQVSFMTKEGVYFNAQVSATSGTVNCSNFQYREIILTSSLSESNDVKLNNDSKGVTINTDNDIAHPSAILDIKSDNSGILIPRIAMANRPASPATGLMIYQVDNGAGFYYYDGSAWKAVLNNSSTLNGGTQVVGANGLTVNTTNTGSGSADWIAINAGGSAGDRVIIGNLSGKATIGGHNNGLSAWSDLTINQDGGKVIVGGQNLTPPTGNTTTIPPRPLVVNGSVRQTYYAQSISLAANSSTTFIWTHNFGYNPVVMMSTSQTNSTQNMENCTYTYYSPDTNTTVFIIKNTGTQTANGNFNWILVH